MLKKIACIFTLALFVGSAAFAQDKVQVSSSDVILMVKVVKSDESNHKIVGNIKNSQVVSSQDNSIFFLSTSQDASESAIDEIKKGFKGIDMKIITLTGDEYLKKYSKK